MVVGSSDTSATQTDPSGKTFTGPSLTPLRVCVCYLTRASERETERVFVHE